MDREVNKMALAKRVQIDLLQEKGVRIPNPESVDIGREVDIDRISGDGVTLYAGTKIYGAATLILRGAEIGYEAPAMVKDCHVGPEVRLKGGCFTGAVFLKGAEAGSGAHVREGTILEEAASIAHTVGLKQTILFPFVTLGSLINFCDCLMSGGTDRKNHSEVGSSYIHFNYSPNQDKATASLLGDVPRGVMLQERPIFLGGQGGLVGPCRLAFGTVIAAGSVYRKDELRPNRLLVGAAPRGGSMPFAAGTYPNIKRVFNNNMTYIANLIALLQWHRFARARFLSTDFPRELLDGLKGALRRGIDERIKRMREVARKMPTAIEIHKAGAGERASASLIRQKQALFDRWTAVEEMLADAASRGGDERLREDFLAGLDAAVGRTGVDYIAAVKALTPSAVVVGTMWLEDIAASVTGDALAIIPELGAAG
jgi:UDP-N-acetylglucosamine/UDP-N-acetylgalactosamine diphosphorylase